MLKNHLSWRAANCATLQPARLQILSLALFFTTFLLPARLLCQTEPSAMLEVQSTDKGFLLPRMTQAQRDAIQSPATGLMIFNTTANCLQINYGSPSSPSWFPIGCNGTIGALNCSSANVTGTLNSGLAASGVSASVPYTGGDGGPHNGQTVASTGVAGLTATLPAGNFVNGSGNLVYAITGTPASTGTASFALSIGGQLCTLSVESVTLNICGAYVAPSQWKVFMCYNLGAANTSADPFTPSWEINGGYWQWGSPTQAAAGPTGPGSGETNEAAVPGWNSIDIPNGAWLDNIKTANDPCPQGFRVPTKAQWDGVRYNNSSSITGSWFGSATNYSSGRFYGTELMLPTAGSRSFNDGALFYRGDNGYYWSSTESGTVNAWSLAFVLAGSGTFSNYIRRSGFPIRCIAE